MKKSFVVILLVLAVALSACGPKPTPTVAPTATEQPAPAATDDGSVSLDFVNNSDTALDLFWVDYSNQETSYGSLAAGTKVPMTTYPTHVWRLRNASGLLVTQYTVTTDKVQTFTVTQQMADEGWSVAVDFVNNSKTTLNLFWVGFDGKEQSYGSVAGGKTFQMSTYPTHVWRVRATSGLPVLKYTVTADKQQTVTISQDMVDAANQMASVPSPTQETSGGQPSVVCSDYNFNSSGCDSNSASCWWFYGDNTCHGPSDICYIWSDGHCHSGPAPACVTDADCGSGMTCDIGSGACIAPAQTGCTSDAQCGSGETCDSGTGTCVVPPPPPPPPADCGAISDGTICLASGCFLDDGNICRARP
jgi:Cys-rich repeat protein